MNTPAQTAMEFYYQTAKEDKKFSGRQRITIATTIENEIKEANKNIIDFPIKKLETGEDLEQLRELAKDRNKWRKLSNEICNVVQVDKNEHLVPS